MGMTGEKVKLRIAVGEYLLDPARWVNVPASMRLLPMDDRFWSPGRHPVFLISYVS
jgi:hypothetical protein